MRSLWAALAVCCAWLICVEVIGTAAAERPKNAWRTDFTKAETEAKRLGLPMLVHFYAGWCGPCRKMEREVLNSPALLKKFGKTLVAVKVDRDRHPQLVARFKISALPSDVFVAPTGRVLVKSEGYQNQKSYLSRVARMEARFLQSQKLKIVNAEQPKQVAPVAIVGGLKSDIGSTNTPNSSVTNDRPAETATVPNTRRLVGLKGYSPVTLWKKHEWVKGRKEFAWAYKGIVYYMVSQDELAQFRANPAGYAPRLLGCDPVILWDTDRAVAGSTRFGAYFDGELYLFCSAETRQRFKRRPMRYVRSRHVLRVDGIEETTNR